MEVSVPGIYFSSRDDPRNILTNKDLEGMIQIETSDEWIVPRTGIKERRVSHDKGVHEIGLESAKYNVEINGIEPNKIKKIIFSTNFHHESQEFAAHAGDIAAGLGITNPLSFNDHAAGCTCHIYTFEDAKAFIDSGKFSTVMTIGSERLTSFTDFRDRNTCVLFGDAASTYTFTRKERKSGDEGLINVITLGRPDTKKYLGLEKRVGLRIRPSNQDGKKFEFEEVYGNYIFMNGREVFRFATKVMREAVHKVLHDSGYTLEDVDVIIPHGANIRIVDAAAEGLRNEDKGYKGEIFTNLDRFGNVSTASIGVAEAEAIARGIVKPGSLVIYVAFGAGFTYGAALVRRGQEIEVAKPRLIELFTREFPEIYRQAV